MTTQPSSPIVTINARVTTGSSSDQQERSTAASLHQRAASEGTLTHRRVVRENNSPVVERVSAQHFSPSGGQRASIHIVSRDVQDLTQPIVLRDAQDLTPRENSAGKMRPQSFCRVLSIERPPIETLWCPSFFQPPFSKDRFLRKTQVPPSYQGLVSKLHGEALAWLARNPALNFPYIEFQDCYLVDRTLISTLVNNSSPAESASLDQFALTPDSSMEQVARPRELTLGRRPFNIDRQALKEALEKFSKYDVNDYVKFVDLFNCRHGQVDELRLIAFDHIETLTRNVESHASKGLSPNDANFTSGRLGLVTLAHCTCPQVKRAALERLIDILNADPISTESFNHLSDLIHDLVKLLKISHSKNCDILILRLMIQAYATSIMTLWLHTETAHNGTLIDQTMKDKIWDKAVEFQKQLVHTPGSPLKRGLPDFTDTTDKAVLFWVDFAIQAAQRLRTEVSDTAMRGKRVLNFCSGVLRLAKMVGNVGSKAIGGPDIGETPSVEGIDQAITDIRSAFYHLRDLQNWYEPTLAFHYLALLVRYYPEYIEELDEMAFRYKSQQSDVKLIFGILSSLEQLLLHTTNPDVAERCYKILMAYLFYDNRIIQQRTIQAFLRIRLQGNHCLSITARCLLVLIWETMTPLRTFINLNDVEAGLKKLFNDLSDEEKQLTLHCLALFIRRELTVQSESGLSPESLTGLVTRAKTDDPDGDGTSRSLDVLKALKKILPNPLAPDSEGNGVLHACVIRCNRQLIPIVENVFGELLNPDATNFAGKTALMLCADPTLHPFFIEGIPPLARLCNPNLRDLSGRTFAHYLVQSVVNPFDLKHILTKLSWKQPVDLNIRDRDGLTPLMYCLKQPTSPTKISHAKALIEISSFPHSTIVAVDFHLPDRDGHSSLAKVIATGDMDLLEMIPNHVLKRASASNSALMLAAKANQPKMLEYILSQLKDYEFTKVEILCLFRCALTYYGSGSDSNNMMMRIIIQAHQTNASFKIGCEKAIPKLSWSVDPSGLISFFCDGEVLELDVLKKAALGTEQGPQGSKLFGLNTIMNATLKSSHVPLVEIQEQIQKDPSLLTQQNVLGRTALLMSMLGGRSDVTVLLLTYENQTFDAPDYAGHRPMHYAAATLNVRAVRELIRHHASLTEVNSLGLIPIVLSLAHIPVDMLPTPVSQDQPYYLRLESTSGDPYFEHHEHFCEILDLMLSVKSNELKSFLSPYGWNLAHWAAVYGHPLQAYAIVERLPELLFARHRPGGRTPIEQAVFHGRPEIALALVDGWITSAHRLGVTCPIKVLKQNFGAIGLDLSMVLTELNGTDHLRDLYHQTCTHPSMSSTSLPLTLARPLPPPSQTNQDFYQPAIVTALRPHATPLKLSESSKNDSLPDVIALAIQKGQSDLLSLFMTHESDINLLLLGTDSNGYTATMLAARYRQMACLKQLLELADSKEKLKEVLDARNNFGQNAVHILCSVSRSQAVDEIMKMDSKLGLKEALNTLDTQLKACIHYLFHLYPESVLNSRDESGQNVAHVMCFFNHATLLSYLIQLIEKSYADITSSTKRSEKKSACVKQLEKLICSMNDDRRPPVFMAVAVASENCLSILESVCLTYGISTGICNRDVFGISCLAVAAQEGHLKICEKILKAGVDTKAIDALGNTALHLAAANHQWSVVNYLVRVCPELLIVRNQEQRTPLHAALDNPNIGIRRNRQKFVCLSRTLKVEPSSLNLTIPKASAAVPTFSALTLSSPTGSTFSMAGFEEKGSLQISEEAISAVRQAYMESTSRSPSYPTRESPVTAFIDSDSGISPQLLEPDTLDPKKADDLLAIMDLFLSKGLTLEDRDLLGWSGWHLICRGPYRVLLDHALYQARKGKTPNFSKLKTIRGGLTVVHVAAQFGQINQLEGLRPYIRDAINIKSCGQLVLMTGELVRDEEGLTPIAIAIRQGHWGIVKWCLLAGCRTDQTTRIEPGQGIPKGPKRSNCLHLIAENKQPLPHEAIEIFRELVKEKPYLLMQPNEKGVLPLEPAVMNRHEELIPLICSMMKPGNESQDSLGRAQRIATANAADTNHSRDFQPLASLLNGDKFKLVLGQAWVSFGLLTIINEKYVAPTIEQLKRQATEQYELLSVLPSSPTTVRSGSSPASHRRSVGITSSPPQARHQSSSPKISASPFLSRQAARSTTLASPDPSRQGSATCTNVSSPVTLRAESPRIERRASPSRLSTFSQKSSSGDSANGEVSTMPI